MYEFTLYVSKSNSQTQDIVATLQCVLDDRLNKHYSLLVVNVVEQPEEADKDNICMTPTLVKKSPPPVRKIIGDITKLERVMDQLIALD
ncbi:MAG: circadian clock protein KaiB [Candidatus Magnetoglobus multicellularis str. Araruama]|uniref:Circadian clock protein KaiB n=1 Tax=Candidatus Magnetoglobus multicellularis str. Araruama TaxID=890399 RepID=A0A1V1PC86_9BACT|nr:MAG: circadian clock protein KaiB [Candidatus Magnetoglobus multicellularis str. Araruama]